MRATTANRTAKSIRVYPNNIKMLRKIGREVAGGKGIPDHKVLDVLATHWFRTDSKERRVSAQATLVPGGGK
jgi:hypothetical protein